MATIEQATGGISFALSDEQKELRALAHSDETDPWGRQGIRGIADPLAQAKATRQAG